MKVCVSKALPIVFVACLVAMAGCSGSEKATVRVFYLLEPQPGIPAGVDTIAIAPARLEGTTDAKWSHITADLVETLLEKARQEYPESVRLRIADRRNTDVVFKEADLVASGLTTGTAEPRLAGIQAYIFSDVTVKEDETRTTKTVIAGVNSYRFRGERHMGVDTAEREKITKTVTAQVTFRLMDVQTGEALLTHSDSIQNTEETEPPAFLILGGNSDLTPADRIVGAFIEKAAREFIAKLVPYEVSETVKVKSGSSEYSESGVRALRADMYGDALAEFEKAIQEDPEDDRSLFAAGVACELLGRPDDALGYYRRAVAEDDRDEYMEAKDRLSRLLEGEAPGPAF